MGFKATTPTYYGSETFHENPDRPGEYVVQKSFDRDPVIERARVMRQISDASKGPGPRFAMSIPVTMFYEWLRSGKIAPDEYMDMPGGGIAIDPKKLAALQREYSRLAGN